MHLYLNVLVKCQKSRSLNKKPHCISVYAGPVNLGSCAETLAENFKNGVFFNVYFPEDLADIHPALCLFRIVKSHITLSPHCHSVITPLTFSGQTLCHLHEYPCCHSPTGRSRRKMEKLLLKGNARMRWYKSKHMAGLGTQGEALAGEKPSNKWKKQTQNKYPQKAKQTSWGERVFPTCYIKCTWHTQPFLNFLSVLVWCSGALHFDKHSC